MVLLLLFLLFATRLKVELIALVLLLLVALSGIVPQRQIFAGFSSSVVITLIGLFVITRGLETTGIIGWIAGRLQAIGRGAEHKLVLLFMAAAAALSLIMNNVAAGAVLLPAAVRVACNSRLPVSKLLLPLSFGTIVGGMATYLTTANILMSELLLAAGLPGLTILDFLPLGGMIVLASLLYMLLLGRHMLPARPSSSDSLPPDLRATYELAQRMWWVRVLPDSRVAHQTVGASEINKALGLTVAALRHGSETVSVPKSHQMIRPQDELLIVGREDRLRQLLKWGNELLDADGATLSGALSLEPIEMMVAPRSSAIGKTLSELKLNRDAGLLAVALWRDGGSVHTDVRKRRLRVGDAVLVLGQAADIRRLAQDPNYILPAASYAEPTRAHKAPYALGITALALALAIAGIVPLPLAMLAGAAAMVISGCLDMEQFFAAVQWHVIFLVAGMLPLSLAINNSGLADRIGGWLVGQMAGSSPLLLIAAMALLTMLVVQVIGGQVTALLVGPIAIDAALQMGLSAQVMALAVAIACSMAFLTPVAHPVNVLMMGPGGYKAGDFFLVGLGMTVVTLGTMLLGLVLLWQV